MITEKNFQKALLELGFETVGDKMRKEFEKAQCELIVDFKNRELLYPETNGFTVNERQTCNFKANENFVVFICICQLFDKGYLPQHIELEPKWKLGHGASGGRADVWVRTIDEEGNKHSLLIVECKTTGSEFTSAWQDTLEDGAQLFSYFQQEKETQFLCLYACDYVDSIKTNYYLINVKDNKELLENLKNPKTYEAAGNNRQLYSVWKETYQLDCASRGLLENDIEPYNIGKTKYSVADLVEVDNDAIQRKYHEFAMILRQHNISGHENAFDKLVNLFLAKVVDETNNQDELEFYWKGSAYDDYFRLQDRMQKLYKIGMEKFLNEDVTYIDNADINNAFTLFRKDPDSTKKAILEYFRQLKFFTNNDFAFIDVHNERLFYQNAAVLKKVVQMLQDIKLKTENQNQFLGDLFEGFLDQGVKQSEGQFFTPIPIVRFLISALPLNKILTESVEPPKVIDYACGAGHFLNEYARQIKDILETSGKVNLHSYYDAITGIEKEYRLSKVAKVSAFMYGQDEIHIIYADALASNNEVKDGSFSILVANPPYSVKGFLETLDENERQKYELIKDVSDLAKNNSIETFFVERAVQLLNSGGVAAIILPSSILSNANIYTKAREILLKYTDIVAISEFGSGTFGKTGTNTVTLFLRRKQRTPNIAEHYSNRVESWFKGDFTKDAVFEDQSLLESYCSHMDYSYEAYIEWLHDRESDVIFLSEMFESYEEAYLESALYKKIIKKKITARYTREDQETEIENGRQAYIVEIEKEKLYYYMLAASNPQKVMVSRSPSEKKEIKKFLGYEWSGAKGNEGIKYLGVSVEDEDDDIAKNKGINLIKTPLFNPQKLYDENKINSLIRKNYLGNDVEIPDELEGVVTQFRLVDMIDFSRVGFDKSIRISEAKKINIPSKFDSEKVKYLSTLLDRGKSPKYGESKVQVIKSGQARGFYEFDFSEKFFISDPNDVDERKLQKGDILINSTGVGTAGRVTFFDLDGDYVADNHITIFRVNDMIIPEYGFVIFSVAIGAKRLEKMADGISGQIEISRDTIRDIKIPVPPKNIQKDIVKECRIVDTEYMVIKDKINECSNKIDNIFMQLDRTTAGHPKKTVYKLSDKDKFSVDIGRRVLTRNLVDGGKYPVYSANVFEVFGYINKLLIEDFSIPSITWGIDGDWMVNYVEEGTEFYPTDHCGVLRVKTPELNSRYVAWLLYREGRNAAFSRALRASTDRIEGLSFEAPPIDIQNAAMKDVFELEEIIKSEKLKLKDLEGKKEEIISKYLN